jgi:DNA-binding CsgD family transcriptional regulator
LLTPLWAICSRGRLRVAQGRFEEALADLFDVGRFSRVSNPAVFAWRSYAAPALAALGRHEEARELLAQELERARCFGVARAIGVNLRATGVLEGGDKGIGLLRESVAALEDCPSVLERARSRVELGSALRRRGRRADSLPWLRDGLELADRAGALALAQRARQELADAGARPHRPARVGRDALTPTELRVARMAAEGATNKEIAQGLFVSLRTVETHLTHTYAKLGIGSRPELVAALAATTAQPLASPGRESSSA